MRRLASAAFAVLATAAVLTASTGIASAQDRKPETHGKAAHAKVEKPKAEKPRAEKPRAEKPRPPKVKVLVTMAGVVADTATVGIALPAPSDSPAPEVTARPVADTATSTITIAVKGGERSLHWTKVVLTFDKNTVVRRGDAPATAADLRRGDHVSVRARRLPGGGWLALRVNAAPRGSEH